MDKLGIKAGLNQYWYVANITCHSSDYLGLSNYVDTPGFPFTPSPDKGSGVHKSLTATNEDIEFYNALKRCASLAYSVYPLASEHLHHYLSNSGNPRSFDLKTFIKSKGLQQAIHNELISLKQFAKTAKTGTYSVRSTSATAGYFKQEDDENLFFAIGGFQLWGNGRLEVCQNGTFQASLTLSFFDRYNWNDFDGVEKTVSLTQAIMLQSIISHPNSELFLIEINGKNGRVYVADEAMGRMHKVGLAQEYDIKGEIKIKVSGSLNGEDHTFEISGR